MNKGTLKTFVIIAALFCLCPAVSAREYILRFTPSIGLLAKNSSNSDPILSRIGINKQLNSFDYILLNMDMDVQLINKWFATGSFMYSHPFYKDPVSGGIDIFGVPLGMRYVVLEKDDAKYKLRYWVGGSIGPYVKNESITIDIGGRNTHGSSTESAAGLGAHTGLDYFFGPNIGLGVQAKFQYILFDDDMMIISGGPSVIGRF